MKYFVTDLFYVRIPIASDENLSVFETENAQFWAVQSLGNFFKCMSSFPMRWVPLTTVENWILVISDRKF